MYRILVHICRNLLALVMATATAVYSQNKDTQAMPPSISPTQLVDALNGAFGRHAEKRASHAKGICARGVLSFTPDAQLLSNNEFFKQENLITNLRFSIGGGNPSVSDKSRTVRGISLRVKHKDQVWDWAFISEPVFFAASTESFIKFLEARVPDPITKRPDPEKIASYNLIYPDGQLQPALLAKHAAPSSYATTQYHSVHAFGFLNEFNTPRWARLVLVPDDGVNYLDEEQEKSFTDNFLNAEFDQRLKAKNAKFTLVAHFPDDEDSLTNPAVLWKGKAQLAIAHLNVVSTTASNECDSTVYIPTQLPKGMIPSDDALLKSRAAAYAESLSRRQRGIN